MRIRSPLEIMTYEFKQPSVSENDNYYERPLLALIAERPRKLVIELVDQIKVLRAGEKL